MVRGLRTTRRAVPTDIAVGGQKYDVDEKAVKDALRTEAKFWREDGQKVEEAFGKAAEEVLQRSHLRVAASMNTILEPVVGIMNGMIKGLPNSATCQVPAFVDCVMKQPRYMRRPERLFYKNPCAVTNKCELSPG